MSLPGNTEVLPLALRKELANECDDCRDQAVPGKTKCQRHLEAARARARRSARKRRRALHKARLCRDCRRRRAVGKRGSRCVACRRAYRAYLRDRRVVDGAPCVVDGSEQIPPDDSLDHFRPDAAGHRRYRGKAVRGKPSTATLDDQDLDWAGAEIQKAKANLALVRSAEVLALPAIQRAAAIRAALSPLDLVDRFVDEVRARHKGGKRQRKR